MVKIILVEADPDRRSLWAEALRARGLDIEARESLPDQEDATALLILGPDSGQQDPGALTRSLGSAVQVLRIVEAGDVAAATEAVRSGAAEVLEADVEPPALHAAVLALRDRVLREALSVEKEELRRRYSELESLVYLISHDLKAPVVSIQGIATILLEGDATPERVTEYVHRVQANAERIEELVRDLLEFPRVGRLVGVMERVEMNEVVTRAIANLAQPIEEAEAKIEVEPELPEVFGDRKRLLQVFHNLLDNAVKYGGEPPAIEVGFGDERSKETERAFFVRDDGEGISPEDLDRAFHLFRRLDGEKKTRRSGMGIGLAVTRRIIEGHGGRIWVESTPGSGTAFYFTLPRSRQELPAQAAEEQPGE